ncbi:DUF3037 domain-containing protein [Limimaricola hongkongensis]|uniref:DUF3037 domain-containing protein n=1 Tax=Limimaricola hongkongensis TaxID=278132 RepID=UPI000361FB32|nr:DUF3037 domain-containing protein [Limimaricola hongkongensis]
MNERELAYSIVQFSPHPERFEFVNVGVLVFDGRRGKVISKHSSDFSRVKKFFGEASPSFLKMALADFSEQIEYEFRKRHFEMSATDFNSKRAGIFQITQILPALGESPHDVAQLLFSELVEANAKKKKTERVSTRLTCALKDAGVLPLLQKRPKAVRISKWGVSIKADYGYQNGVYNLIDSARFDSSERGLAEAGKRVLEGKALAETLDHRLIVVGDFGDQMDSFVSDLKEEFLRADSRLYTLNEVDLLAEEIRRTAH